MPDRRVAKKYVPPEPVETKAEFTGMDPVTMYLCTLCGRSGQDKKQIAQHIKQQHPGGEES